MALLDSSRAIDSKNRQHGMNAAGLVCFQATADLKVKVVGEEEEDFWGTDGDVGVQQVRAHLNGVPLPKQIGINLLLALVPAGLAVLHVAQQALAGRIDCHCQAVVA